MMTTMKANELREDRLVQVNGGAGDCIFLSKLTEQVQESAMNTDLQEAEISLCSISDLFA